MRHIVNFGLLIAFVVLLVTGILEFWLPFSITTARVHIVAGVTMSILVAAHVFGRLPYFKKQLSRQGSSLAAWKWIGLISGAGLIFIAAWIPLDPVQQLMNQSYESRNSAEIVRMSSLTGLGTESLHRKLIHRATASAEARSLSVYVSFRERLETIPACAVWAETTTGTMIETLYLDQELAFSDQVDWQGSLTARNHVLPIWRNRYTLVQVLTRKAMSMP